MLKIRIFYGEDFIKRVKSVILSGLEGEGENEIYQVTPREGEQSLIVGIKPGKYLVNVIFESEGEERVGLSYALWDLIDGSSEMRLENTVKISGRGNSYLNLYIAEGRGIGGAFKLKEGKETEILWLEWPESMLSKKIEISKKISRRSRTSSGEEVCSFWDGSCRISLDVDVDTTNVNCNAIHEMGSTTDRYCFGIPDVSEDEKCKSIADAGERKAGGFLYYGRPKGVNIFGNVLCSKKEGCESGKCKCVSEVKLNLSLSVYGAILVLEKHKLCKELNISDDRICQCRFNSLIEHEKHHCHYFLNLLDNKIGLQEALKETVEEFCTKNEKAPLCKIGKDCHLKVLLKWASVRKSLLTYFGDMDEAGAVKVQCDYQKEHGCTSKQCLERERREQW